MGIKANLKSFMDTKPDLSKLIIERSKLVSPSPRNNMRLTFSGALLFCTAIIIITGYYFFADAKKTNNEHIELRPSNPSATVPTVGSELQKQSSTADRVENKTILNATGYVVAQRRAAVASKATGRLVELYVEEGDSVEKDQLLGLIENDDLKAEVAQLEAQLEVMKARINYADAEVLDSKAQLARIQKLRTQGVESQEQLDQAIARANKATAELDSAKANSALGQAQLDKARIELSYTEIKAPIKGTVLTKNADIGEIVAPFGAATSAKAAIVTIADMTSLEVEADVSEANLSKIYVGQKCFITLDSLPSRKYDGEVKNIVPTVDRAKATVLTKIKFINRDDKVIPEMSAKVAFFE